LRESYKKALDAAEELRTLVKRPLKKCPSLQWYEVKALHALGRYAEEMKLIREMAKRYGTDMRLAEIYRMGYEAAKREQDELQRVWLLKRLIDLQNSKKSHPYSPWAEFELMRLLKAQKAYKEALKIAESMRKLDLKGERAARGRLCGSCRWYPSRGACPPTRACRPTSAPSGSSA
jgi:tetratricopeptide (TPR) repeat protein